ncbi:MAG TPA: transcriptional regulator NrdR [Candidatus Saccharimonadales bacterium]|nr:transcriptional regulator NrdR [Candidatus Saccharimonadales bacterium]
MRPKLKIGDSRVIESRESSDGLTIRRRRESLDGKHRFTTYERIERPNLTVIKKDGTRELFDREKLAIAVKRSVGKFFSSEVEIEDLVDRVEDALYGTGDGEVTSRQIGDLVLDELAERNEVAYVRFASVYHEFKTLDEFEEILKQRRKK